MKLSRRALLISGAVAGGGLLVGVSAPTAWLMGTQERALQQRGLTPDDAARLVANWIRIDAEHVTLLTPHIEMGQGANTGLMQIVAEELRLPWQQVRHEQAPATSAFANGSPVRGFALGGKRYEGWRERLAHGAFARMGQIGDIQFTGGSTAVRFTGWLSIRVAAAGAMELLLRAASVEMGVDVAELTASGGHIVHAPSGEKRSYGQLAELASGLDLPSSPTYRPRDDWRVIGTSPPRRDLPDKVFVKAEYGIDVEREGMAFAAARFPAQFRGSITSIDNRDEVLKRRGVERVVELGTWVAVVADNPWRAEQAARALKLTEGPGPLAGLDSADLLDQQRAELGEDLSTIIDDGDVEAAAGTAVEAEYTVPYLAHACMEPMNATAWFEGSEVHVAAGLQNPLGSRDAVADVLGVDEDQVVIHPKLLGGGFGRRSFAGERAMSWLLDAATVAREAGKPVKLLWSRENDTRLSTFRQMSVGRFSAKLGDDGRPVAWDGTFWGRCGDTEVAVSPYGINNKRMRHRDIDPPLPWGYWRSVDASHLGFFVESFVDELAAAAGADPVDYRLSLLDRNPRFAKVLSAAAEMAGWRHGVDDQGRAMGVALVESFGSIVAEVAEVSLDGGRPRVHRVWCAVDPGVAVNPRAIESQLQGGVIFGLSAALWGRIDVKDGAISQSNFHDYRMVRLSEAPITEVKILQSGGQVGGIGEVGVPPIAPAVANALALLGKRPRDLPLA